MPKHLCSQLRVTSVVCYPHTCPGDSPKHQGPQNPASPQGLARAADGPITDTYQPCSWPAPVARLSPALEGQVLAWVGLELPVGGSLAIRAGDTLPGKVWALQVWGLAAVLGTRGERGSSGRAWVI